MQTREIRFLHTRLHLLDGFNSGVARHLGRRRTIWRGRSRHDRDGRHHCVFRRLYHRARFGSSAPSKPALASTKLLRRSKVMARNPSNQSMKPTAPLRNKFRVFATTPWISSRCPTYLVRLKLVRCPHLLAPTLVVLPSMSLGPSLHSLGSRTPAVLLKRCLNASRDLSLSR